MARPTKFEKTFNELKGMIEKADTSSWESCAFQCCITGDGEGTFYIAVNEGKLSVEPFDYEDHTAVFKADAETFKNILSGKTFAEDAVNSGALVVEDNVSGCADVLTALSGKAPAKKAAPKKEKAAAPAKKAPAAKKSTKAPAKKSAKPAAAKAPAAKKEEKPVAKAEEKPAVKAVEKAVVKAENAVEKKPRAKKASK